MSAKQHPEFVEKLEKLYGKFEDENKKFENASNSIIARTLGYSDAQFSRLINQSATEGEYQRAIQNIDRILKVQQLEATLHKVKESPGHSKIWKVATLISGGLLILLVGYLLIARGSSVLPQDAPPRDHTLQWAFESAFINPYVKLDDLPDDCNYPCYKYQGKWKLDKTYKLPFFRERNGFHYLATSVDMYSRCMVEKNDTGNTLEGFEYQKHEIWYDKREWPIDSFMVEGSMPSEHYQSIDFNQEESFVKLANLHTFFRNEFSLNDSAIHRTGKVIGRELELIPADELRDSFDDEEALNTVTLQLNTMIGNRLADFSVPINCKDANLIHTDFAEIKDGDLMSFDCQLTTSGFPIDYTKAYVLVDQYIKNNCMQAQ